MFIFRAYQANLSPTRLQMQRLINTGRYVMYLGTNRISGYINGTSETNSSRHERHYFKIIPEREKIRLCPLILQGNYGGLHKIRFRNSA
jgi:hypothetical protein